MVSQDGEQIMDIEQACEDNPGEVSSMSELAQQKTHRHVQSQTCVTTCTKGLTDSETLTCRWVVTSPNGQVKARLTTRDNEQELHDHEDVYSGTGFAGWCWRRSWVTWLHSARCCLEMLVSSSWIEKEHQRLGTCAQRDI